MKVLDRIRGGLNVRFDFSLLTTPGLKTWHSRPIMAEAVPLEMSIRDTSDDFGIVMQGPIVSHHGFTLETLKLYRRMFPNSTIVLSTWENAKINESELAELGIELVKSPDPGIDKWGWNLERQYKSTQAGLDVLRMRSVKYALKTRTDQRFYNQSAVHYLKLLHTKFPPSLSDLEGRILFPSQNSFINRPLSASDFMQFGFTSDLTFFWMPVRSDSNTRVHTPEQTLVLNFLTNLGVPVDSNKLDKLWLDALAKVFCVFDASSIDWFWLKYSNREFMNRKYSDSGLNEFSPGYWARVFQEANQLDN